MNTRVFATTVDAAGHDKRALNVGENSDAS